MPQLEEASRQTAAASLYASTYMIISKIDPFELCITNTRDMPTCLIVINHPLTTTNVTFRCSNLYTHEVYLGCIHAGMIYSYTVLPKLGVVNCGTKKLKTVLGKT